MAATPSTMKDLNTSAIPFILLDTLDNNLKTLDQIKGEHGTVIMFICNHCPYVKFVNNVIVNIAKTYIDKGIAFVAISSNDAEKYPDDAPDKMKLNAIEQHYPFPYLYDYSQDVAKAYDAACTPDFFVYDKNLLLKYRGQLDEARPNNGKIPNGNDLINAIDCILSNTENLKKQYPSIGCNIKWKV
jgi:thiol-disulfide isomerase/thioredoxin